MDLRADPSAPLPTAPTPWASTDTPSRRDGPPFHMTEMIEAEPRVAVRILDRLAVAGSARRLAAAIRETARAGGPIVTVGCGTSEHAAQAIAEVLREAMREAGLPAMPGAGGGPIPIQAFEAALVPGFGAAGSLVIGVSHEGGTAATNDALTLARDRGATVALVTASAGSPGARFASLVLETVELDQSWCHTVGYLSPIVAAVAAAAELTATAPDAAAVQDAIGAGLRPAAIDATEALAGAMADRSHIVVIGTGADRIAARELVLKLEEGAHLPAAMRDLETLLHGHLAGIDERTGVVAILTGRDGRGPRIARLRQALTAVAEVGALGGAILAADAGGAVPAALTPAGRIVVGEAPTLPPVAAALLSSATPLQLLTERVARARGVDPDPIRRDEPRYLRAADAASGPA
ncbi:MAG TPA: SIS domain-containing protein [Candidatus Limnocylindrales bacterium]|jgi:fructoselysine-6-P-deglycase FrlB-like protein